MIIAKEIKEFIEKQITLSNYCMPWNYPKIDEFEEFQAGYRYNAITEEDLTGNNEGDFRENWYVVCSNYFDDPFFVDFSEDNKNYPVYFAFHGAGKWIPIKVAESLTDFTIMLSNLHKLEKEKEKLLRYLSEYCDLQNELWKEVYEDYQRDEKPTKTYEINEADWINGKLVILNIGKNKLNVVSYLKKKWKLTPQQALALSKENNIELGTGYFVHLEQEMEYLKTLEATVVFIPDEK